LNFQGGKNIKNGFKPVTGGHKDPKNFTSAFLFCKAMAFILLRINTTYLYFHTNRHYCGITGISNGISNTEQGIMKVRLLH